MADEWEWVQATESVGELYFERVVEAPCDQRIDS